MTERLKDKILKGKSIPFKLNNEISFNIDSRTRATFESFLLNTEINNFISFTKNKVCLLDIGAHHGVFSLVFTTNHPHKTAFAFDPSPRVFDLLSFNIKINPKNNIKAYQCVVGDNNEPVAMKFESINQLSAVGEKENVKKHKKSVIFETITMDQFISKHNIQPDVIKIDTEGFEYQVLKGGYNYLKTHDPLLFLEIHPPKLLNHRLSVIKIKELLDELGYKNIYDLDGNIIKEPEKFFDYKVPAYRTIVRKN